MKHSTLPISFICIVLYITHQLLEASGIDKCQPGEDGHMACKMKRAYCQIKDNSYTCECPTGMYFDKSGVCEDIDMCKLGYEGHRSCTAALADCLNAPGTADGYKCYCPEGKAKINDICEDVSEVNITDPTIDSISLPSSVLSSSGIQNISIETLSSSSEVNITYLFNISTGTTITSSNTSRIFNLSTGSSYLSSSFDLPVSTTSFGYDISSQVPVSDAIDANKCLRYQCSLNATCVELPHGFKCVCKTGFVPQQNLSTTLSSCIKNCAVHGCEDVCKQMKCFLTEDTGCLTGVSTFTSFRTLHPDWSPTSIIICSILAFCVLVLVISIAYLFQRYRKLKKSQNVEKQIVYQKMDKRASLCSESVRELLPDDGVVISYIFPSNKTADSTVFSKLSPC